MSKTITHIKNALENSYTYEEYVNLVEDLLTEGKTTTKGSPESYVHYSKMGLQRMKRWGERLRMTPEDIKKIQEFAKKQTWVVISEGWCGDAAHLLPVIYKITENNPNIKMRVVLREENLELMKGFLTNGGKSIPKLIMYNPNEERVENDWGPRPEPAQKLFLEVKKNGVDFDTYEKELQKWYNKDKGQTAIKEIIALMK